MQIEIFADIVFFINFFMDFFIFWITAKLCRKKISIKRLMAGSFAAALIYCFIIFVCPFYTLLNVFFGILILTACAFFVFRPKNCRELLKYVFIAHVSAFAVGGLGLAVFYFTDITSSVGNFVGFTVKNFPFKILLASTCISYIIIKFGMNIIHKTVIGKKKIYSVKIALDNNDALLEGLMDSGNSLVEPVSGSPVIIAEFESIKNILPQKVSQMFSEHSEEDLEEILNSASGTIFAGRIRMIPFSSLGMKNGMLVGFKADRVKIYDGGKTSSTENVVIGIYNSKFTKDDEYQALLNPELL